MHSSDNPDRLASRQFGWRAALIGGGLLLGGDAFFGTLIFNLQLRLLLALGLSVNQAWAAIWANGVTFSPWWAIALLPQLATACAGGYVSAQYGRGTSWVQGAAAGACGLLFILVMRLNPTSASVPPLIDIISTATPLLGGLAGGLIYARRGR